MKILILDIETAPNLVYVFQLWNQNIPISKINTPGYTLCWTAKWLDKKEVYFEGLNTNTSEEMILKMYKLVNEADAVITYNGINFDNKVLNKDYLLHGLTPPAPYSNIDLYQIVKRNFRFESNKLDYVAQRLGIGKKTEHTGHDLWVRCMNGEPKAWATMKKYNIQDVKLTESLYYKLQPWIRNHPRIATTDSIKPICNNCGSYSLQKRGYAFTRAFKWQRYRCNTCGTWKRGERVKRLDTIFMDA